QRAPIMSNSGQATPRNSAEPFPTASPCGAWVHPKRWRTRCCSWPRTTHHGLPVRCYLSRVRRSFDIQGGSAMPEVKPQEPWQWPEEHWRKLVNQVRAGRSYRPATWKGGARCAFALSFDSDHETNELRDGGKSIGRMCWGQYGNRVGVPRILRLLDSHGVKATFYVPAVAALIHPDEQRRVIAEGHEIGIHGWIHELNSVLPYQAERELMLRSADTLEKITGKRAVGLRTPSWDFSPNTLRIEKELGLAYDSSLMADEDCYELLLEGEPTGIIELPVEWVRDDAVYFMMNRFTSLRPYTPPTDVLDIF